MRVVITGAAGLLARALALTQPEGLETEWLGRGALDVTDPHAVESHPALRGATTVIHTAAYTSVDEAEQRSEAAWRLNAAAPAHLAARCVQEGARLVAVGTDYVFGAPAFRRPLPPTSPVSPMSVYGASKAAGELAVLSSSAEACVVRTSWLFSGNTTDHRDFVSTMLRLAEGDPGREIRVVNDQHGSPTYAVDLARALWRLAQAPQLPAPILHGVGVGEATWYEVAREAFAAAGHDPGRVTPCTTEEFPRPARRPEWSVLDPSPELSMPGWRDGVRRAVAGRLY